MNKNKVLTTIEKIVKKKFLEEGSGHDWWHIDRVRTLSAKIAQQEKADSFIVELGALLHDIADFKFHEGDETIGPKTAAELLKKAGADTDTLDQVVHIVSHVSFKGEGTKSKMESLEGKIVQDADRLDAIGAIGIARTFTFGGWMRDRAIYNPDGKAKNHKTFASYKKHKSDSTIHHFYEKLLLLKDLMNTKTGKRMALARHKYMEKFLEEFFKEWDGVR